MKPERLQEYLSRSLIFFVKYSLLLIMLSQLLTACGQAEPTTGSTQAPVRVARPTFTPTVVTGDQPAAQINQPSPTAQPPEKQTSNQEATATPVIEATATPPPSNAAKPMVLITEELVNLRTGPGINYDLVDTVKSGEKFDILGKTSDGGWWKICCVNGKEGWVINQYVDSDGDLSKVVVINDLPDPGAGSTQPVVATPIPVVANPAPAAPATATTAPAPVAPAFSFELVGQEQFPDTNLVHIFLFVFEGPNALSGYTLRMKHNGVELPSGDQVSIGPQAALTWPIADARQRLQNLKVEFPGQQPGGNWEVQLMLDGQPVGPVATFKLADNEPNRELYVRYQKK